MRFSNTIELEISGDSAMFTDPSAKAAGRLSSYPVPTYEALKGVLCSIYWKPTFIWVPDRLRVMNRISFERYPVKLRRDGRTILTQKRRLVNVRYQLRAHFIWNENRPDLSADRDEDKHFHMALRSLSKGGRRGVYLGTADCPGYVRSVRFGSGRGFYDGSSRDLGEMYHGISYPDGNGGEVLQRSFHCVMSDGSISFPTPEECRSEVLRCGSSARFGRREIPV